MVRAAKLHQTFLGGLQVSQQGDLANWLIEGQQVNGMGGAMDLVASSNRVIILMKQMTKGGQSKIVKECSYALTGRRCVDIVITDMAVFRWREGGMVVEEIAEGVSIEQLRASM